MSWFQREGVNGPATSDAKRSQKIWKYRNSKSFSNGELEETLDIADTVCTGAIRRSGRADEGTGNFVDLRAVYPSHCIPNLWHRWQNGLVSSHLTLRVLKDLECVSFKGICLVYN